jgi:hypothetical protein
VKGTNAFQAGENSVVRLPQDPAAAEASGQVPGKHLIARMIRGCWTSRRNLLVCESGRKNRQEVLRTGRKNKQKKKTSIFIGLFAYIA